MTDSTAGADRPELVPARRRLPAVPESPEMREWAEALVERARAEGVALTGEGGLLTALMGQVLQTGLEVELADHLGYEAYDPAGRGSGTAATVATRRRCRLRSALSSCACPGTVTAASSRSRSLSMCDVWTDCRAT